jgi:hypothetical protein
VSIKKSIKRGDGEKAFSIEDMLLFIKKAPDMKPRAVFMVNSVLPGHPPGNILPHY